MLYAASSSRTTHGAPAAVDACVYLAVLLVGALQGRKKEELLQLMYTPVPDFWDKYSLRPEVEQVAKGSYKVLNPPLIKGSGYVVQSLEAALWAFYRTESFEEGCLLAVNLGDDADTTGAVYGQLAGAYYGIQGIPERWLSILAWQKEIGQVASGLLTNGQHYSASKHVFS